MADFRAQTALDTIMMTLLLQPLTESWLCAALDLDQQVLGGFWNAASYQTELTRPSSDFWGLWSPQDPALPLLAMGCAWAILDEAHIILMAVHPQYRQCGFGYGVLLALLERALCRGLKYATLEVSATNEPAIALYTKLGFTTVGTRPRYYSDTGEDALVMWRSGLQSPAFEAEITERWQRLKQRWQQANRDLNPLPYLLDQV